MDIILQLVVMDHNLQNYDFCENRVNLDITLRNTINVRHKSNKCNQCEYETSVKGNLKSHLKTHTREKPNECKQCNFVCSQAGTLKRHLIMHGGEKLNKCN